MLNNDILRQVRYALDLRDNQLPVLLRDGGLDPEGVDFRALLAREDEEGFRPCNDKVLAALLDGVIVLRRGRRADAPPQPLVGRLSNNLILKKLRIAFELKQEDVQQLLADAGLLMTESELGAFFRKPGHKHYRECGDQVLRNLLRALSAKLRPAA
ncbi:YehS family protein [Crenobacter intestini]|uniref:DUF1456 family protein n=1 Tax=Crenobacter intestini TaxID=2563443 RepID=A0A4T0V3L2_9NEIS|nr:DUF1456 family protein [Crenobacter intestini]TIC86109.1 DUF1456 family protein [Crenobacter intestini]